MLLKKGDKSSQVREWQEFLNTQGEKLVADGNFGNLTEGATMRFQAKHGLREDGIVGQNTYLEAAKLGFVGAGIGKPAEDNSDAPLLVEKVVVEPGGVVLFEGTKVGKINAAMLAEVAPTLQRRGTLFIEAAQADGVTVQIVQGLRTIAEQNALFAKGRTKPGKKVTNARGGQSLHNYGLALDFAPVVNGVVSWDENLYKPFGKWADIAGLEWGGRWKDFIDLPHVQDDEGMTLKQIQELYRIGGLNTVWNRVK